MTDYFQIIVYPRVTLRSDPEFDVWTNIKQPTPGRLMTFVHLDVYHYTPSVMKRLIQAHNELRPKLPDIVFCHASTDDSKFHRFVTRFGWRPIATTPCSDGLTRRIYVNFKKVDIDGRRSLQDAGHEQQD